LQLAVFNPKPLYDLSLGQSIIPSAFQADYLSGVITTPQATTLIAILERENKNCESKIKAANRQLSTANQLSRQSPL
jgi:hypothetical protein